MKGIRNLTIVVGIFLMVAFVSDMDYETEQLSIDIEHNETFTVKEYK